MMCLSSLPSRWQGLSIKHEARFRPASEILEQGGKKVWVSAVDGVQAQNRDSLVATRVWNIQFIHLVAQDSSTSLSLLHIVKKLRFKKHPDQFILRLFEQWFKVIVQMKPLPPLIFKTTVVNSKCRMKLTREPNITAAGLCVWTLAKANPQFHQQRLNIAALVKGERTESEREPALERCSCSRSQKCIDKHRMKSCVCVCSRKCVCVDGEKVEPVMEW